ncbi:hypothetical protein RAD16_12305 [Bradyrhizobium sp. 18BD]
MTSLLQNLVRLGRGEPIAGAARIALPPRFAAPVRTDNAPMFETGQAEGKSPPHQTETSRAAEGHPRMAAQVPQPLEVELDNTEAPLRPVAKAAAMIQPVQSNTVPPGPLADRTPPVAPRDPPAMTPAHEPAIRETLWTRRETATLPAPPLGEAVLAGQAQRRRETPPVIKVTIDRIDIRSPEPPRAARGVKPASKPSVSLSDYLRRPGPGGRA